MKYAVLRENRRRRDCPVISIEFRLKEKIRRTKSLNIPQGLGVIKRASHGNDSLSTCRQMKEQVTIRNPQV